MSQEWKLSFTCALLALFCLGCSTEKAPPLVHWISPQSAVTVDEGDALGLKFSITDPAPSRGETEAASWRVTIGTESGTTWWTTSGTLSAAPEAAVVTDTIETTWQVPTSLAGSSGPIDLQLSAVCTDGEGQTGADFAALTLNSMPLTSSGLWWDNGTNSLGFVNPQANTNANFYPGPNSPHEMVYLDGEDLLVCGTTEAQGWLLTNGVPATEPVWSITPSVTTTGQIRHVRRAPFQYTSSSWAEIGWSDRCTWLNASGLTMKSWLLNSDEQLIDGGAIDGDMVLLARTTANDLRMIRFNLDNSARLESVTWTPQASGSIGPGGDAWLLQQQEHPVALEANGTLRLWNSNGGATPLSTSNLPGEGNIIRAGRMENGQCWAQRNESLFYSDNLSLISGWNGGVFHVTADRATGQFWVLTGSDEEKSWQTFTPSFEAIGPPILAGSASTSGSVSHNRPGPL